MRWGDIVIFRFWQVHPGYSMKNRLQMARDDIGKIVNAVVQKVIIVEREVNRFETYLGNRTDSTW